MLLKQYPHWKSVDHYVGQWRNDGPWRRIHDTLRAEGWRRAGRHKHPTAGCLDSQSCEGHGEGHGHAGRRGYEAGKQVKGRKRHLLGETLGLLLAVVVVTAASLQGRDSARQQLAHLPGGCTNYA